MTAAIVAGEGGGHLYPHAQPPRGAHCRPVFSRWIHRFSTARPAPQRTALRNRRAAAPKYVSDGFGPYFRV